MYKRTNYSFLKSIFFQDAFFGVKKSLIVAIFMIGLLMKMNGAQL